MNLYIPHPFFPCHLKLTFGTFLCLIQVLRTILAEVRPRLAYTTLLGAVIYMYGRMIPAMNKLEAQSRETLSVNAVLTKALELLVCYDHR
jgi:flagellar motor component MotA